MNDETSTASEADGTDGSANPDRTAMRLTPRILQASGVRQAGEAALASALAGTRFDRAALLLGWDGTVRACTWAVPPEVASSLARQAGETGSRVGELLASGEAAAVPTPEPLRPHLGDTCLVLPFPRGETPAPGAVILAAAGEDDETGRIRRLLDRLGQPLVAVLRRELLRERADRVSRENRRYARVLDAIPDPVLLTDEDNDLHLANERADELFVAAPSDSPGRSRAVQMNTFLLSTLLTDARVSGETKRGRDLNLVHPEDGSDLVFEVLTLPLRPGKEGGGPDHGRDGTITVLRDITDLQHVVSELEVEYKRSRSAEHRARRESQRLNAILSNVAEPILVTDSQADIVLMNREAEKLFGASEGEREGEGEGERNRPVRTNVARLTSFVSDSLLRSSDRRVDGFSLVDPDTGETFPVEAASAKIHDDRGEVSALVTVLRDLTAVVENERLARELRQLNEDLEDRIREATEELEERNRLLEWQSRELEKASRLKSQFLANMSHELRTPINAMLGYSSLLQDRVYGELAAEQESALSKLDSAAEHLLELINDILDLSKIEAGKMPLRAERVRLPELLDEIIETISPLIGDRELAFEADLEDDLPPVVTDRTKLRQVLINLLDNAVKYTPEGSVTVRARRLADRDGVRIVVEDTGIGIDREDREVIFDSFRQADQTPTREHGGTGLGLAISRKLLSLMNGSIELDDGYDEGTRFVVELPLELEPGSLDEQVQRVLVGSSTSRTRPPELPEATGNDATDAARAREG